MKLFVALGSGDIVGAHRAQMNGRGTVSETSIIFSGQVLEYCRQREIETLALSHNARADSVCDGMLQIENRPRRFEGRGGVFHHWSRVAYAAYLALRAYRFGADLAIIDSGSAHYFALGFLRLFGIPVAVNFHNVLWPSGFRPTEWTARTVLFLDAQFFGHLAVGAIGCSPECGIQVRQLAGRDLPYFDYRSQFRAEDLSSASATPNETHSALCSLGGPSEARGFSTSRAWRRSFASSRKLASYSRSVGKEMHYLSLGVSSRKEGSTILCASTGVSRGPSFFRYTHVSHAVIVPTRSQFSEGLPLVCAEAVLSGLPIVTSRLSNAIPVLGPALALAEPENIDSYVAAIRMLAEDCAAYDQRSQASPALASQFVDRSLGYPAAIDRLVAHLFPNWKLLQSYEPLFERISCGSRPWPSASHQNACLL